jgi:hypothetical protein
MFFYFGRLLAFLTNIYKGWKDLPGQKHTSLLRKFVNYDCKKFCDTDTWKNVGADGETVTEYFCRTTPLNIVSSLPATRKIS